jgi:hypothetical protein
MGESGGRIEGSGRDVEGVCESPLVDLRVATVVLSSNPSCPSSAASLHFSSLFLLLNDY